MKMASSDLLKTNTGQMTGSGLTYNLRTKPSSDENME